MRVLLSIAVLFAVVIGAYVAWRRSAANLGIASVRSVLSDLRHRLFPAPPASFSALQRRALRRMRAHVTAGIDGVVIAPGTFTVGLAIEDHERLEPTLGAFASGLEHEFSRLADRKNWRMYADVRVEVLADEEAVPGSPRVHSRFEVGTQVDLVSSLQATVRAAMIEDLETGATWLLPRSRAVVGRSSACEVRIDHPHVSRRHCELRCGTGDTWTVTDLGSSNGTFVEQQRLRPGERAQLPGDLRLGKSLRLRLHT